jgi:glycosyltransferase involved in cell wall biosynthesis
MQRGEAIVKTNENPLVSVLTPVYNGEAFLAECIESVLAQTYRNFEYIIVNNCSTDRSLEMALDYQKKDPRIRVHSNVRFVDVIANHNIAFGLIAETARYCKVVSADDFIFPECLSRMITLAEENPSVAMVGSYQLSGRFIRWQGFAFPREVIPGREIGRQIFLGDDKSFGHGSPTSLLYRADIIRDSGSFYPNSSPHSDTSACFQHLCDTDFGFVYQVLSYERVHSATQSSRSAVLNRYAPSSLNDISTYGPSYLTKEELRTRLKSCLDDYYRFLAVSLLKHREREFWEYHRAQLRELGFPLSLGLLLKALVCRAARAMLSPVQILRKIAGSAAVDA